MQEADLSKLQEIKSASSKHLHHGFDYLFPYWAHRRKKRLWIARWSTECGFHAGNMNAVPGEIKKAVETGWFVPGSAILDIGCGSGEIASWLAQQGYKALGVDFSKPAIEKARLSHPEIPGRLEFKTLDIVRDLPGSPRFDALIDRGCFQGIPKGFARTYVRNVATWSRPGGRFLLIVATYQHPRCPSWMAMAEEEIISQAEYFFCPAFEIAEAGKTQIEMPYGQAPMPGVVFWMVRR